MSQARVVIAAFVLGSAFAIGRGVQSPAAAQGAAAEEQGGAAALVEAGALERLAETRWASRAPSGAAAPSFVVDPSWPKPLPNNWRIGQVGGIAVDSHDNIWVYHRPRTLESSSAGAMPRVSTNDAGVPISALGHARPYAERNAGCCEPAPAVLKFDREGNLLDAWGEYVGHFGAYGQNPVTDDPSSGIADTDVGPWIEDYQAGRMKPMFFRGPVHCATVSRDGFLYVCDRGNNRVQVFDLASPELGQSCANPNAEAGKCGFVREVHVAPQTAAGTSGSATLSADPMQSCLYVGDLSNNTLYILNRENLTELDRIGRPGRQAGEFHWLHAIAVDSVGNLYTGEVDSGQRVQKFLRYGSASCSGSGSREVGSYSNNR
jgi:hypothetical protein